MKTTVVKEERTGISSKGHGRGQEAVKRMAGGNKEAGDTRVA